MWVNDVDSVRSSFASAYEEENFVINKDGSKMVELCGQSFLANKPSIFGKVNYDYVERELEWYKSQSRFVDDIPGNTPKIWTQVSDKDGKINSNYGWCIWSDENHNQYDKVLNTLKEQPWSRQAVMIYTRPTMHEDAFANGMHDFMCTNAVQYLIRDGQLNVVVQMRSNDAWAGYRNDYAWQEHVQQKLANDLDVELGYIWWQVGSLHVYERDFWRIHGFILTNNHELTKSEYEKFLPSRFIL